MAANNNVEQSWLDKCKLWNNKYKRNDNCQHRILTIGDPHFMLTNQHETKIMHERILSIITTTKPDFVVVLGDVMHNHKNMYIVNFVHAMEFLGDIQDICPLYILVGNHDRISCENAIYCDKYHPFTACHRWNNTIVADKPLIIEKDDRKYLMTPYVPDGHLIECLDKYTPQWKEVDLIFAHQEFYGVKMGAIISERGDVWDIGLPLVITGHVHQYQRLQANILYVGTPLQHGFGDTTDKTVSIFDINHRDDSMATNGKWWVEYRFYLDMPPKKTIIMGCSELTNEWMPPEGQVRIVLHGTRVEYNMLAKMKLLYKMKNMGVKIKFVDISEKQAVKLTLVEQNRSYITHVFNELKNNADLTQMLKTVCEENDVDIQE